MLVCTRELQRELQRDRETDRQTHRHTDTQTDTDRQMQTDRQTHRHTDRDRDRQKTKHHYYTELVLCMNVIHVDFAVCWRRGGVACTRTFECCMGN